MSLGPARGIRLFLSNEVLWDWLWHLSGLGIVIGWLVRVCHLSLVRYDLLFVYPGLSLALLRYFAEHRAAAEDEHRTAIVVRTPLLGLLFLHNSLHVVHHARPGLAWYRIPAAYRAGREIFVSSNGGLVYAGYRDVARRYLFRAHDVPWRSM